MTDFIAFLVDNIIIISLVILAFSLLALLVTFIYVFNNSPRLFDSIYTFEKRSLLLSLGISIFLLILYRNYFYPSTVLFDNMYSYSDTPYITPYIISTTSPSPYCETNEDLENLYGLYGIELPNNKDFLEEYASCSIESENGHLYYIYSSPDSSDHSNIIGIVSGGEEAIAIAKQGDYYFLYFNSTDEYGWISEDHVVIY